MTPPYFFVFDVESVGLHGEGFAFGYVVIDSEGKEILSQGQYFPYLHARGMDEGRAWVESNVPDLSDFKKVKSGYTLRRDFWNDWQDAKKEYPGIVLVADCAWPVEARFLIDCVNDNPESRTWEGPYPLHDLASVYLALGLDPLATNKRLLNELPAHNPVMDARQSARLLIEALKMKGERAR